MSPSARRIFAKAYGYDSGLLGRLENAIHRRHSELQQTAGSNAEVDALLPIPAGWEPRRMAAGPGTRRQAGGDMKDRKTGLHRTTREPRQAQFHVITLPQRYFPTPTLGHCDLAPTPCNLDCGCWYYRAKAKPP